MRGRTVIAIAHRLSTVRNFDRIVVLKAGQVIQDGPPDHLMRNEGVYRSLIRREMSRLAKEAAQSKGAAIWKLSVRHILVCDDKVRFGRLVVGSGQRQLRSLAMPAELSASVGVAHRFVTATSTKHLSHRAVSLT
jgi:ABC-type multidrug transport system ATPase subunit